MKTALIFFALLASPLGAPIVGLSISWACDLPWDGSHYCAVPEPFMSYFVGSFYFAFLLSPVIGVLWVAMALALLGAFIWDAAPNLREAVCHWRE